MAEEQKILGIIGVFIICILIVFVVYRIVNERKKETYWIEIEENDFKNQKRDERKFDPVGFIVAVVLVGAIVVIAMNFLGPTIGNVYPHMDDLSYRATQAAIDCNCKIRRDAWWDGLPEGKLVVIIPKTLVLGEQNQAIAFAYSPEKFSIAEIDEYVQRLLLGLNLSEDKAIVIETEVFLDTWGFPLLDVPGTLYSFDKISQFIDPDSITVWELGFMQGHWWDGLYDFLLRFRYDEERSESAICRRICGGNIQSGEAPSEKEHIDVNLVFQSQTSEYPFVEIFNSSQDFVSTDPDLYINEGFVHWNVSRGEGVQYIYRTIPPFSGDVKITVTGQIDGYTGNCEVRVGIGDGIPELGETIHDSGISIHLGFVGESCPNQRGSVVRASGVEIYDEYVESECSKSGAIWVYDGTPITASIKVEDHATPYASAFLLLDKPNIGGLVGMGGDLLFNGEYNTLFVGLTDIQEGASCWGKIDSVVIEPLNEVEQDNDTQVENGPIKTEESTQELGQNYEISVISERVLEEHNNTVYSVEWSPDGTQLASAGKDNQIIIWDVESGTVNNILLGHSAPVWAAIWSPDGEKLASTGEDGTIRIWDTNTGALLLKFDGNYRWAYTISWSPDGTSFATGSYDGIVRIWDASSGNLIDSLNGRGLGVWGVDWAQSGNFLASSHGDGRIRIWDVNSGEIVETFNTNNEDVYSVTWSNDERMVVTSSKDSNVIQVWQLGSGLLVTNQLQYGSWCADWSPIYNNVYISGDSKIRFWDLLTGTQNYELGIEGIGYYAVDWSLDGMKIAAGANDGNVYIWEISLSQ